MPPMFAASRYSMQTENDPNFLEVVALNSVYRNNGACFVTIADITWIFQAYIGGNSH